MAALVQSICRIFHVSDLFAANDGTSALELGRHAVNVFGPVFMVDHCNGCEGEQKHLEFIDGAAKYLH